jgi:hypothetical protein
VARWCKAGIEMLPSATKWSKQMALNEKDRNILLVDSEIIQVYAENLLMLEGLTDCHETTLATIGALAGDLVAELKEKEGD